MDSLRKPLFLAALVLILLAVLVEVSSVGFLGPAASAGSELQSLQSPGLGISYLALVDGILLFSIGLMALGLVIPARIQGRLQGIVNFIFFLLLLLAAIGLVFLAILLLTMMITLLLAVPFGTIAYMAAFADFNVGAARATLGTIMTLKLAFAVCLVLSNPRFLEVKGLMLLVMLSLLANVIVSFLHGLGPTFVVSILDALAAIVVGIIGAIWALVSLIGSIPAIIKLIRVDRALA
ncbi:MAG: hypothetical protein QNK18_18950 [Gammaproteobacteria bacterium]|nr:hypothetical protein [Gammaproteobacteria bacterium]